jgi:hypothetical protein
MEIDLEEAHKHSINNKREIEKSDTCGCFYCREIFVPSEIKDWIDDSKDKTAQCPYCWVDSVIGNASGYEITLKFLQELNKKYFGDTKESR